ncbi:DMT family transporter [Caballeronia sp. LZ025]|uniref:DMT family transporter n=1 Tax=Caballeronia TaxID=1827195 RepID=UPI001FD30C90|nr:MULTISPECIES: DMT family transporter [Caballeronia]MDR5731753.1 DMT family transporter [Caballeronia sp. LZ025]
MTRRFHDALPTLAIMLGASVWGVVWYPMRMLASMGLTGTVASAATSGAACLCVLLLRRRAISTISWHWLLVALGLAAGMTSVGFVWGAIHGQVMRVLLLFYLTPAWTAVFAHFILKDRLTRADAALSMLSLAGALTMLWSPSLGMPLPANLAEWAGLMGGMGFAMSNVLVVRITRTMPRMKPEMRTAVIFGGAAVVATLVSFFEPMPAPPAASQMGTVAFIVIGLGVVLAVNNVIVQIGLARVPANRASIIMLFELVVTALSSWLFAGEVPGPREWAGGACIVAACVLSAWVHRQTREAVEASPAPSPEAASEKKPTRAMV